MKGDTALFLCCWIVVLLTGDALAVLHIVGVAPPASIADIFLKSLPALLCFLILLWAYALVRDSPTQRVHSLAAAGALMLYFFGDIFMDAASASSLPAGAFFAAGHIVYALPVIIGEKKRGKQVLRPPLYAALATASILVAFVGVAALMFGMSTLAGYAPSAPDVVLSGLYMACMATPYAKVLISQEPAGMTLALTGFLFFALSDAAIFFTAFAGIAESLSSRAWITGFYWFGLKLITSEEAFRTWIVNE